MLTIAYISNRKSTDKYLLQFSIQNKNIINEILSKPPDTVYNLIKEI